MRGDNVGEAKVAHAKTKASLLVDVGGERLDASVCASKAEEDTPRGSGAATEAERGSGIERGIPRRRERGFEGEGQGRGTDEEWQARDRQRVQGAF